MAASQVAGQSGQLQRQVANSVVYLPSGQTFDVASGATLDVNGTFKIAGTAVDATAAEINRACDVSARLVSVGGTALSVTAASHDGKIILMDHAAAASTCTLPAASGTGAKFTFVVAAVNTNNHIIKVANASDVMYGNVWANSTGDTPDLGQPWPTAVDSDTITLNGTTTGGLAIGDMITVIDIATNKWLVLGHTTCNGTEATPFSASV